VKKSVNQDDVSAYHLFYADKFGSPGTDMTFFDWPHIGPNVRGTDSIAGTAFRVASREALDFWTKRLEEVGSPVGEIIQFAGRELLPFEDPEGQQLYLVNDAGSPFEGEIWQRPDIPDEFVLRGFYSAILSMPSVDELSLILAEIMNFENSNGQNGSTEHHKPLFTQRCQTAALVVKYGYWSSHTWSGPASALAVHTMWPLGSKILKIRKHGISTSLNLAYD
jgi:catechol 2,3-dioxygenase-like lactoylglutathione lyase family enzyme